MTTHSVVHRLAPSQPTAAGRRGPGGSHVTALHLFLMRAFIPACSFALLCFAVLSGGGGLGGRAAAQERTSAFVVQKFAIDSSDVLTDEELASVTERYRGRPIVLDDLYVMVAELDALYEAKGFVARAMLPPQTIADGVVEIQLIEGRIDRLIVLGAEHTSDAFVTHRLDLQPGDLVDLHRLADALARFNELYDVELRAELRPGERFGTTDYVVYVGEPRNDDFSLWIDNGGRTETGADRYGFAWTRHSLSRRRDTLAFTVSGGPGSRSASAAYDVPVGRRGASVGLTYLLSEADVIGGGFGAVDLHSATGQGEVTLQVPFALARRLPASWSFAYNTSTIGVSLQGHSLSVQQSSAWQTGVDVSVSRGAAKWNFGYVLRSGRRTDNDRSYVIHKLSGRWERALGSGTLSVRANVQLTGDKGLPESEQSSLGGADSNRGYPAAWRTGDRGYGVNVQYGMRLNNRMQGTFHLDHGGVVPYKGDDEPVSAEDFLTSAAAALHVQITELVGLRLQWGVPLDGHGAGNTFHFRLQADF